MNEKKLNSIPDDVHQHSRVREVLFVDEEPFLLTLSAALSIYKKYFNVRTAIDGIEAVNILKTNPAIDLVVADLGMPKGDGFELIAHIRNNFPKIPVIVTTFFDTPKLKEVLSEMGIFHYMEKPLDITLFRLRQKRIYSPSLTYVYIQELAEKIFSGLGLKPVKLNPLQAQMKISVGRKKEIQQQMNAAIDLKKELLELASSFKVRRQFGEAIYCYRELLERSIDKHDDVTYLFALGQIVEKMHDFESALNYYREAANLCSAVSDVAYWINNNTGYCLCMLKRFAEAEHFCRVAIDLDSSRFDAFKNLGFSLQGQGKLRGALDAYIKAIKIYPQDVRAMNLFEIILDKHPELKEEYAEPLEECRNMVQSSYQYHKPEKLH